MRSTLTVLTALLVMGSATLAQPRRPPRTVAAARDAGTDASVQDASTADAATDASTDAPRPRSAPTCCCRAWSHGWQYAWRTEVECGAQNGSCVSPDHC
jgi:hypothetical protein